MNTTIHFKKYEKHLHKRFQKIVLLFDSVHPSYNMSIHFFNFFVIFQALNYYYQIPSAAVLINMYQVILLPSTIGFTFSWLLLTVIIVFIIINFSFTLFLVFSETKSLSKIFETERGKIIVLIFSYIFDEIPALYSIELFLIVFYVNSTSLIWNQATISIISIASFLLLILFPLVLSRCIIYYISLPALNVTSARKGSLQSLLQFISGIILLCCLFQVSEYSVLSKSIILYFYFVSCLIQISIIIFQGTYHTSFYQKMILISLLLQMADAFLLSTSEVFEEYKVKADSSLILFIAFLLLFFVLKISINIVNKSKNNAFTTDGVGLTNEHQFQVILCNYLQDLGRSSKIDQLKMTKENSVGIYINGLTSDHFYNCSRPQCECGKFHEASKANKSKKKKHHKNKSFIENKKYKRLVLNFIISNFLQKTRKPLSSHTYLLISLIQAKRLKNFNQCYIFYVEAYKQKSIFNSFQIYYYYKLMQSFHKKIIMQKKTSKFYHPLLEIQNNYYKALMYHKLLDKSFNFLQDQFARVKKIYEIMESSSINISELAPLLTLIYSNSKKIKNYFQKMNKLMETVHLWNHQLLHVHHLIYVENRQKTAQDLLKMIENNWIKWNYEQNQDQIKRTNSLFLNDNTMVVLSSGLKDSLGKILYFTKNTVRILGFSQNELKDANVSKLQPKVFGCYHQKCMENYLQFGKESVINKVRQFYLCHSNQMILKTYLGVQILNNVKNGLQFVGSMQILPSENQEIVMLTSISGEIDSFSNSLIDNLRVNKENLLEIESIYAICPELKKIYKAFNQELKNNIKYRKGSSSSFSSIPSLNSQGTLFRKTIDSTQTDRIKHKKLIMIDDIQTSEEMEDHNDIIGLFKEKQSNQKIIFNFSTRKWFNIHSCFPYYEIQIKIFDYVINENYAVREIAMKNFVPLVKLQPTMHTIQPEFFKEKSINKSQSFNNSKWDIGMEEQSFLKIEEKIKEYNERNGDTKFPASVKSLDNAGENLSADLRSASQHKEKNYIKMNSSENSIKPAEAALQKGITSILIDTLKNLNLITPAELLVLEKSSLNPKPLQPFANFKNVAIQNLKEENQKNSSFKIGNNKKQILCRSNGSASIATTKNSYLYKNFEHVLHEIYFNNWMKSVLIFHLLSCLISLTLICILYLYFNQEAKLVNIRRNFIFANYERSIALSNLYNIMILSDTVTNNSDILFFSSFNISNISDILLKEENIINDLLHEKMDEMLPDFISLTTEMKKDVFQEVSPYVVNIFAEKKTFLNTSFLDANQKIIVDLNRIFNSKGNPIKLKETLLFNLRNYIFPSAYNLFTRLDNDITNSNNKILLALYFITMAAILGICVFEMLMLFIFLKIYQSITIMYKSIQFLTKGDIEDSSSKIEKISCFLKQAYQDTYYLNELSNLSESNQKLNFKKKNAKIIKKSKRIALNTNQLQTNYLKSSIVKTAIKQFLYYVCICTFIISIMVSLSFQAEFNSKLFANTNFYIDSAIALNFKSSQVLTYLSYGPESTFFNLPVLAFENSYFDENDILLTDFSFGLSGSEQQNFDNLMTSNFCYCIESMFCPLMSDVINKGIIGMNSFLVVSQNELMLNYNKTEFGQSNLSELFSSHTFNDFAALLTFYDNISLYLFDSIQQVLEKHFYSMLLSLQQFVISFILLIFISMLGILMLIYKTLVVESTIAKSIFRLIPFDIIKNNIYIRNILFSVSPKCKGYLKL